MKFIRKLIVFIVLVVVIVLLYRHYKPQIADFLIDKGINIPGVTDDVEIFPSSETVTDQSGNVSIVVSIPPLYSDSITDEHINQMMTESEGRFIATREDNGSVSITVSEEYRDEILNEMSSYYDDAVLNNLINGQVLSIEHNADYTVFTVTCVSGMPENDILTLTGKLFAVGKLYSSFEGRNDANICVIIVDSVDSSVTNTYVSDNIGEGLVNDAGNWAGDMFDNAVSDVAEHFNG